MNWGKVQLDVVHQASSTITVTEFLSLISPKMLIEHEDASCMAEAVLV
jgi:hypothetical protein